LAPAQAAANAEVEGSEYEECPAYPATQSELKIVARHWMKESISEQSWGWYYDTYDYSAFRRAYYADQRLNRLEAILGEDEMAKVGKEVEEELRKLWGGDQWEAWIQNDTEWWDQNLDRIYADLRSTDKARDTAETPPPNA
jgi:hypothetical protein